MYQYEVFELALKGPIPEGSFVHVEVYANFELNGKNTSVKGFYAGNGIYKVRYYPSEKGICSYAVTGVVQAEGREKVLPARKELHGQVKAKGTHFQFEDGTFYYPFGTTVYAMLHQEKELIEQTFQTLQQSPFNKIRICVFPKDYLYNKNEPDWYAFEKDTEGNWDVNRPCFAFWDALEKVVYRLGKMEIQTDLILFHTYDRWGFSKLKQKDNLTYLEYLMRRLSAIPNLWWSMANEYDLCDRSLQDWCEIEEFIAKNDPYHHLLSNHNCYRFWDFERENITHASIQTKMLTRINEWCQKYKKPIMIDECCYEGNLKTFWGSISGREMVRRFWKVVTTGGYCTHGETFLDSKNDVIWWAKGGTLKGDSPKRIAFLKEIVESLPEPLEAVPNFMEKMVTMSKMETEKRENIIAASSPEIGVLLRGFMRLEEEMDAYAASEATFEGHCKEKAYLFYYDTRCCVEDDLMLPKDRIYKVELIDTWNMTREVIAEGVNGHVHVELPGKEDCAILATEMEKEQNIMN